MKQNLMDLRRLPALFLSLWLCISLLSTVAGAVDTQGSEPSCAFADVRADTWFYGDIMYLYEKGIVSGYPDGKFRPDSPVTCAESMKMVLTAAGCPISSAAALGKPWYTPYYTYAAEKNVVDCEDLSPDAPITRAHAVRMIVRTIGLPLDVNVTDAHPFADDADVYALMLHSVGILRGETSGDGVYFRGERWLTRAELSTLVARMIRYLDALPSCSAEQGLIPVQCALPESPTTVEDFVQMLICLSVSGTEVQDFVYRGVDVDTVKNVYLPRLREAYPIATDLCRESVIYFHYFNITLAYVDDYVTMTVQLRGRDYTADQCRAMLTYTVECAEAVSAEILAKMAEEGEVDQMTYARRCLDWICENCTYLDRETLVDQYAYSVFADGTSVCSGYTAAYNLLLKLGGVKCMSMTGNANVHGELSPHAWTIAELDGEICMIDATWCDREDTDSYFAVDEETFSLDHIPEWDFRTYWSMLD